MKYKVLYLILIFSFVLLKIFSQDDTERLLQSHMWGLHSLIQIDSVETSILLGDSDSRIIFNSDGSLLEYDTGIERDYFWTLKDNLFLRITRSNDRQD
ncbi:MAG: hypothetical protein AAGA64_12205 [Bacteroidota bacterium]